MGVPAGGATCKITVDYTYIDTSAITGGYALFRLTPPSGSPAEKKIDDAWGFDNSATGELSRTFTVYPNNRYVFTIYCSAAVTVLPIVQVYTHSHIIPCVIQEHTKDSKITLSFLRGKQSKL